MWTPATRAQHTRGALRFATDLTDAEWAVLEPLFPAPSATGRPPTPLRDVLQALFYVMRSGCPWRLLPKCFPPYQTAYGWFATWRDSGAWEAVSHALVMRDRERAGREASPTACILDSQSVKTTEAGGERGYDAAKKVKGRKRHAMVDTDGRALVLRVGSAAVQDRDGAVPLLQASRRSFPFVELAFADSAYAGDRTAGATLITIEIVRARPGQVGFAVQPRRWVAERFFAWISRNRRLAKDFEATLASATAFLCAASVMLLTRRLGRC
jgi:putative transposase